MATIRIHTTQNVTLEYEAGSIGTRIVATLLDMLVLVAWSVAWTYLIKAITENSDHSSVPVNYSDPAQLIGGAIAVLIGLVICVPFFCYSLLCEAFFGGQSVGKKVMGLRVVRLDGTAPRLGDYFLRWLLRLVDIWFGYGLIAVIAVAASGKGQRLGDMAAGTTVISLKPRSAPLHTLASSLMPEDYQPVFPQAADLSDHDVALLRQLLERSVRQENYVLLNDAANKVKGLLSLHSELSDETFLRTVLRDHAHIVAMG